jgi:hypothetical protein
MFVEVAYTNGTCPICGGTATNINSVDAARDAKVNGNEVTYQNFVTYVATCDNCFVQWYTRCYTWVDDKKCGFAIRRSYVSARDYLLYENLLKDMVDKEAELLSEGIRENVQYCGKTERKVDEAVGRDRGKDARTGEVGGGETLSG